MNILQQTQEMLQIQTLLTDGKRNRYLEEKKCEQTPERGAHGLNISSSLTGVAKDINQVLFIGSQWPFSLEHFISHGN